MIRIRVLGSLAATVDKAGDAPMPLDGDGPGPDPVDLGGRRQRSVLALLLVARGDVVSVDRLIDDLWHGEPPPRALGALQAYISNLRRLLEPDRAPRAPASVLISSPPGYAVRLDTNSVDAWRFEAAVRAAPGIADPRQRRAAIEETLSVWNGPAYAEFAAEPWAQPEATRLEDLRLAAREMLATAALDAGDPSAAAAEAQALTREHPLREEGWRLLALARYAVGRQADALAALRQAREVLADELGIDPGPALVQLESDLLAQRIPVSRPHAEATARTATAQPEEPAGPARAALPDEPAAATEGFVGREAELEQLHRAAGTDPARSRVVLLSGEAGSGKSLLLNRFRRELEAEDWLVTVGRCPETEGAPPAWAWVEALRSLTAAVDPGENGDALAPLLDDSLVTAADTDASFGRFMLHRAVARYLAEVTTQRPLAIVLDDVHRGDAETLALLSSIVDNTAVLAVVAYRPDEVSPRLEGALAAIAKATQARIKLAGLASEPAAALLAAVSGTTPDPQTVSALLERTGGNPFYLRESARLLGSEGELVATSEVPEGVRDVLRRRFSRLPEISVAALRMAAVVGRQADIEVLLRSSEADEDSVLDAIEAGVVAGLLDEPDPGTVRFTHALVRDTLYQDISRLRRARWHLRVAEAIEELQPNDVAALAHHFGESLSASTARRAADAALAAADQAERRFAHDAAAGFVRRAIAALDRLPGEHAEELVTVLARLSGTEILAGDAMAARVSRDRAIDIASAAERDDLLIVALTCWDTPTPWVNRSYGDVDERVVERIEHALAVPDLAEATRVRLQIALVAEVSGDRNERAYEAATEAVDAARRGTDQKLLGLALSARISVFEVPGAEAERERYITELTTLGERAALPAFALMGHFAAMQVAATVLDFASVERELAQTERLADRFQWRQAQAINRMSRGFLHHLRGDLDLARECFLDAHIQMKRDGAMLADGILLLAMFSLMNTEGKLADLAPMLESYEEAADAVVDALALARHAAGDGERARRLYDGPTPIRPDYLRSMMLTVRGMTVAALDLTEHAREVYRELLAYRGQIGGGVSAAFAMGPVDIVLGDLARLLDDPDTAKEHYTVALDVATRCGCAQWIAAARERLTT
ncbi:BTAD domain-containing putative transcriptional regulator [Aldersonia kunmingensis]|uniref:BTAD domain-containing putative transcriptional regulator n=1 Tax=Aldersonia kunmingensis TaxID=408066 RepID=UPI000834EAC6|nr:BTAD domain-containing putative transcriptional regulator [Aldersonia kunmingensis]